ncbi:hypothetical protein ACFQYP_12720 [Nonomuraea antimicrobica]
MNKVTFDSDGVTLTGDLYLPEGRSGPRVWWWRAPGPASRS